MFKRARAVSDIFLGVLAVVVVGFAATFGLLIWNAMQAADAAGVSGMFTSYGYIMIEATFLCLVVVAGYFVFQVGLKRLDSDNEDEDLMDV